VPRVAGSHTTVRRLALLATIGLAASTLALAAPTVPLAPASEASAACGRGALTADQLNSVFSRPGVGATGTQPGYAGGDYQRSYRLPDGRVLWLFQDVFFSADDDLRDSLTAAAHNAGLVQDGTCFTVVGGPGRNLIGHESTVPLSRWFWALDGAMGHDGMLWVFVAEIANPNNTGAGPGMRPVGTWIARLDPSTLAVVSLRRAADDSTRLYGWSVVSDGRWSYLYGHCYRQFVNGASGLDQFDPTCSPHSYLARVPQGRFDATPRYWTGSGWSTRPARARPVSTRGAANPMSVRRVGSTFVNVTKTDDWWGLWIHVDTAPTPMGPWQTAESVWIVGDRKCEGCGIYHAHLTQGLVQRRLLVATSNGAPYELWYRNADLYRPTFRSIEVPRDAPPVDLEGTRAIVLSPRRVVDTATRGRAIRLGEVRVVDVARAVPDAAIGVRATVTVVDARRPVQVHAWACGSRPSDRPAVRARHGGTASRTRVVALDAEQRLCLATSATADVRVDVVGALRR
jgi:hypothetical protein